MQLTFTCIRCCKIHSGDFQDAKPIRGSAQGLPKDAERPITGYIAECPHCGATNMVALEKGK